MLLKFLRYIVTVLAWWEYREDGGGGMEREEETASGLMAVMAG